MTGATDNQGRPSQPSSPPHAPRVRAFLGRRFSPGDYLGLHLTVGLLLTLALLGLFAVIAHNVVG